MEKLVHLLKLTQEELKTMLYNYLIEKQMNPIFEDGFVYAKGEIPILLVAHMDTVFNTPPKNLYYDKMNDEIFSNDGGIGGDDRCGVYAIMKILEDLKPHVLFTEDEEIGGIGAQKAVEKMSKPNIKYIIEFDRKGSNDCVFYDCGNDEFIDYIKSFGFVTNHGTFSDISILGSEWDVASVNLSSGYYFPHTESEYIKFRELEHNINRVKLMLKENEKAKYFDYKDIKNNKQGKYLFLDDWFFDDFKLWLDRFYTSSNNVEEKKLILRKFDNQKEKNGDK